MKYLFTKRKKHKYIQQHPLRRFPLVILKIQLRFFLFDKILFAQRLDPAGPKIRFETSGKPNLFFIRPIPHTTARLLLLPVHFDPCRIDTTWPTNRSLGGQEGILPVETRKGTPRPLFVRFRERRFLLYCGGSASRSFC